MKVFYRKEQSVKGNNSFSPSAGKPYKLLKYWEKYGFPIEIESFKKLTPEEISLAHEYQYVTDVLNCKRENGFSNRSKEVADSLPYTTGSIVAGAFSALKNGISVSLTSGFHHSCYDSGGGFCTFNGLMIASQMLKRSKLVKKVGILDCDQHYGNGTEDIIRELKLNYISHYTLGGKLMHSTYAEEWLDRLPKTIEKNFKDCDIILYQAGADCHINDPLGGLFTTEQLQRRDRIVFETCKRLNIPICYNLAGGYQEPLEKVLEIHTNTLIECLNVYEKENIKKVA